MSAQANTPHTLPQSTSAKKPSSHTLTGAGLGFRRDLLSQLRAAHENGTLAAIDFFEVSPENWLGMGGRYHAEISEFRAVKPFVAHGLSLSLGSIAPLDTAHLAKVKNFLKQHDISLFTEHLSWCSDDNHLYDLLPIPLNAEAVTWVAQRIRQTQDILERKIGIENASVYFTPPNSDMTEAEFITAVLDEADCYLHLDVNNIYVNSQNFGFDGFEYLDSLPLERTCYIHVAGHYVEEDGFIVDTHGNSVIDPVWQLLEYAYQKQPSLATDVPTCLERDFNFPALSELVDEVKHIRKLQLAAGMPAGSQSTKSRHVADVA